MSFASSHRICSSRAWPSGVRFALVAVPLALALAVVLPASNARAAASIDASLDFDNVASGSTANAALGTLSTSMHFANPDIEFDVDESGAYTGGFHWIDATAIYGDVRVTASTYAVSGANVLSNDVQPIMLVFDAPVTLTSFAIQQDLSGYGNPQFDGTRLAFLDASGHEMTGSSIFYTQFAQPGLTLQTSGVVASVSAVLLAGGSDYDNLRLTAVSAVPEPASAGLLAGGLGVLASLARRRWAASRG